MALGPAAGAQLAAPQQARVEALLGFGIELGGGHRAEVRLYVVADQVLVAVPSGLRMTCHVHPLIDHLCRRDVTAV